MKCLANRNVQLLLLLVAVVVAMSVFGVPIESASAGASLAFGAVLNTEGADGATILGNAADQGQQQQQQQQGGDDKAAADKAAADKAAADAGKTPEQLAAEQKAADDKAAADKAAADAKKTPEQLAAEKKAAEEKAAKLKDLHGAPEKYEAFKMPEGVAVDAEITADLEAVARECDLSQVAAQKVADLGAKMAGKWREQLADHHATTIAKWAEDAQADKEFGGEQLKENMSLAAKVMATFGTPELKAFLDQSGAGNHPELIRAFIRMGKAISEDKFVSSGRVSQPAAKTLTYPNSKHV